MRIEVTRLRLYVVIRGLGHMVEVIQAVDCMLGIVYYRLVSDFGMLYYGILLINRNPMMILMPAQYRCLYYWRPISYRRIGACIF